MLSHRSLLGAAWLGAALLAQTACLSTETVLPPETRLAGVTAEAPPVLDEPAFVGLEVEETLSGSLSDLAFLPGLTVISVANGSPAQQAGIRRGDRLVSAEGTALEFMDQWSALLAAARPGQPLRLEVERETGRSEVTVTTTAGGRGQLPAPVRFTEHQRARVVLQSVAVHDDAASTGSGRGAEAGATGIDAEVIELLADSPLAEAGVRIGDRVRTIDGHAVQGAGELVARLAAREFGATIELGLIRDMEPMDVEATLWSPPRHVTEAAVPILFGYSADVAGDEVRFALLDFWVLSLFEYHREGQTRSWSVLRFFRYETGAGELVEVQGEAGEAGE